MRLITGDAGFLLETLGLVLLWFILIVMLIHTAIRIIRRFVKFPIPSFLVQAIDNPLRRKIQSPQSLLESLQAKDGMRILEVGPGSGTYTQAFSEVIGETGLIAAVDIEMRVLSRLKIHMADLGLHNVYPIVADVHKLPFERAFFDAVYLITVIGEIPAPQQAFHSFFAALKPRGRLMFSEFLLDPDFPLPRTLRTWAIAAGFGSPTQQGNLLTYTITFERPQ